jgi:tetratricopeptide (TPR) repeat protein
MEYLFLENYLKAKVFFLKCVEHSTYDYQSLYNLLYCYEQLKESHEAIDTLNNILETNPYSEIAWHQLGKLFAKIEKPEEALSAFEFAIISDDSFTGAYIEKGKLLEKMGQINEAIENYEISLQLNDPNAYVNHRIGKSHLKLGNDDLAVQFFKKSIKLEPNHEKSWISLVDFFLKKKEYLKAQHYVRKSILANGDSPDLWRKSAEIHFEMNFYEEAALGCENAVGFGQNEQKTWVIWMDSLIHLKEWGLAIKVGEKALQYHDNKASFIYRVAGCKMRIGMKKEGLKIFEKAKQNLPLPSKINHLFPEFTKI